MGATKLALAYGRSLELRSGDADTLQVRSATGEVEVTILITPDGPSVRLRAVDIEVEAARAIRMRCETFDLETSGDARIAASHGGVAIHACDDVDLRGERVLLNADVPPIPATWEAFEESCARRAATSISPSGPGSVEPEPNAPDSEDSDGGGHATAIHSSSWPEWCDPDALAIHSNLLAGSPALDAQRRGVDLAFEKSTRAGHVGGPHTKAVPGRTARTTVAVHIHRLVRMACMPL